MLKKLAACLMAALMFTFAGCADNSQLKAKDEPPAQQVALTEVTVYRVPTNGGEKLEPEKVKYASGGKSQAQIALEALVNTEPTQKTMTKLFPSGTKVRGVTVKDGVAYADFSAEFGSVRVTGSLDELMMLNSIVATLTEIPGIQKVQILVEGQKIAALKGGHLDLTDPLERDMSFLK